jgi:hypothetical protein
MIKESIHAFRIFVVPAKMEGKKFEIRILRIDGIKLPWEEGLYF